MIIGPVQVIACPFCQGLDKYISGITFDSSIWTDGKMLAPILRQPRVIKCRHCGGIYWLRDAKQAGLIDPWAINPSFQRAKPGDQRSERFQFDGDGRPVPSSWMEAKLVNEPPEEEYYQAIEKGVAHTLAEEKVLRIHAWWRRNDHFRENYVHESVSETRRGRRRRIRLQAEGSSQQQVPVLSSACRKNLEALADMLDIEDEIERIMQAEALRELGEFEAAKKALKKIALTALVTIIASRHYNDIEIDNFPLKLSTQVAIAGQIWGLCDKMDTCVKLLDPLSFRSSSC